MDINRSSNQYVINVTWYDYSLSPHYSIIRWSIGINLNDNLLFGKPQTFSNPPIDLRIWYGHGSPLASVNSKSFIVALPNIRD